MYNAHARATGFSVRKGTKRTRGVGDELSEFYFFCSCEGLSRKDKYINKGKELALSSLTEEGDGGNKKRKSRTVNITRTDCKARIRFKLDEVSGRFIVVNHELDHNHPFVKPAEVHHLRSQRNISSDVGEVIRSMVKSGLKPMDSYNLMVSEAGGEQCVGHTKKDHFNYINNLRMSEIEGGDMQAVLDRLEQISARDPNFFYRFKRSPNNSICAIFWRDSGMLEDYKCFGDLLIMDTTHRTNKYGLICAPFVGINNHWRTCMFGCAFIADEKTETFVWLLEALKLSMCNKEP